MTTANLSKAKQTNKELIAAIEQKSGVKLTDCYQCGKCSAGCPAVSGMDLTPRQIIRYMQLGMVDEVLQAKTPWLCAACSTCYERCPQDIDLATLMEVVRQEGKARGIIPVKESDKFHGLFLKNIEIFGKSHEMFLSAFYNLTSGHIMQDVPSAPHMYFKKMIRIRPHTSKDRADVAKMMKRAKSGGTE